MQPALQGFVRRSVAVLLLALAAAIAPSLRAAPGFSAGAARADITPDPKLTNWITHKPYGEVLEPIFVRAVVLSHDDRRRALVSWELLYPMESAVGKVRKRIAQATGIVASDILVCATHNHSAPWSPMAGDPLTRAEAKVLAPLLSDPLYPAWAEKVIERSVQAVQQAEAARRPATLAIGRAYLGDLLFNRRPLKPDGTVASMPMPADANVLPQGLRFGRSDPTLTLLVLRDERQRTIAALYHLPCHAVTVYPACDGVSGDWPGAASDRLQKELGGEAIFLQGCAGDMVPVRRGLAARDELAKAVAERALKAASVACPLTVTNGFDVASVVLQAPVKEEFCSELGRTHLPAEVQVLTCGSLALVALPGEPLMALSLAIQERSPFPHTLVLGYANGYGVQYTGLPGEQARGGYEMGARNLGSNECGQMLVDAALRLLEAQNRQ